MAYFPDLTPYTYLGSEPGTVNVGWLDLDHPFTQGEAGAGLLHRLARLTRVNQTRGYHFCQFCLEGLGERPDRTTVDLVARGSAEVGVPGRGVTYAAPELIGHYIADHQYLPPPGFCVAVLSD